MAQQRYNKYTAIKPETNSYITYKGVYKPSLYLIIKHKHFQFLIMKKFILLSSVLFAMFASTTFSYAQTAPPTLIVAKFHADWCGKCKGLPTMSDLENKFKDENVLFVVLDMTNKSTKHQSELLASALGITSVYEQNNSTGFLAVIDTKSKMLKTKLYQDKNLTQMTSEIKNLL